MSQATGTDVGMRKEEGTHLWRELALHQLGLFGSLGVIRCQDHQSHSLCLGKDTVGASRENISENSPEEKP